MRYWWVNQNQTFRQEQDGGYLWSPKRKVNEHRNHFYDTMREVSPGDLVLSFKDAHIPSIGAARSYCYESPKPTEFGSAGSYWSAIGWRIDVHWTPLGHRIRPADHMAKIRPFLPGKYAPLRAKNGHGLQSVYLTELPPPLMEVLTTLIGYEVRAMLDAPQLVQPDQVADRPEEVELLKRDWEDYLEGTIEQDNTLPDTERVALVRSRRGQGRFRDSVRRVERRCRVTRVDNPEHLIASHCKPWRHGSNEERLDGENGLLLTPSVDHLFDRGFISFEDEGRLIVSPVADERSLQRMGIPTDEHLKVGAFSSGQRHYLQYHRDRIFLETPHARR